MPNSSKNFKIVEKFKYLILISLIVILAGGLMMAIKGINIGIDFTGGTKLEVDLGSFASVDENKQIIEDKILEVIEDNKCQVNGAIQVSTANDGGATFEIRLNYYHGKKLETNEEETAFIEFVQGTSDEEGLCQVIQKELETLFNENQTLKNSGAYIDEDSVYAYTVGATASSSLLKSAIWALLVAIVVMLIYIVIRFTLSSALSAVIALLHDVLIMIALTTLFQVEVNSTFIAAVITIVGYSINATIIIFDRVREMTKSTAYAESSDADIANQAIKETLVRTILTTITTLVMVIALAVLSVSTIQEFIFPIIFGLLAGTFSSIILAPSIWVIFRKFGKKVKTKKASAKN